MTRDHKLDPVSIQLGRLMGALEAARAALGATEYTRHHLPEGDRRLIAHASEILHGIEQRLGELLWSRKERR